MFRFGAASWLWALALVPPAGRALSARRAAPAGAARPVRGARSGAPPAVVGARHGGPLEGGVRGCGGGAPRTRAGTPPVRHARGDAAAPGAGRGGGAGRLQLDVRRRHRAQPDRAREDRDRAHRAETGRRPDRAGGLCWRRLRAEPAHRRLRRGHDVPDRHGSDPDVHPGNRSGQGGGGGRRGAGRDARREPDRGGRDRRRGPRGRAGRGDCSGGRSRSDHSHGGRRFGRRGAAS